MSVRALLASALTLGLAAQPALPPPQGSRAQKLRAAQEHMAFMAHHLKLTEAQRTQIKGIHTKHQEAIRGMQRSAMEARQSFQKAAAKPDTPVATLRSLHQAAADKQFDVLLERRAAREEARNVLTPEQRTESDRILALAQERREFRMERMRKAMERRRGRGASPGPDKAEAPAGPGGPFED